MLVVQCVQCSGCGVHGLPWGRYASNAAALHVLSACRLQRFALPSSSHHTANTAPSPPPMLRQPLDDSCASLRPFPSAALPVATAALRRRLTAAIHDFQGAAAQYEEVIRHGLDLEAVVKCRQLGVYEPPGLPASAAGTRATLQRLVWRYRCSVEVSKLAGRERC